MHDAMQNIFFDIICMFLSFFRPTPSFKGSQIDFKNLPKGDSFNSVIIYSKYIVKLNSELNGGHSSSHFCVSQKRRKRAGSVIKH